MGRNSGRVFRRVTGAHVFPSLINQVTSMNATELFISTRDSFAALPGVNPAWIRSQLIGQDATAQTPFGERRIVYADFVASWRSLQWIEILSSSRYCRCMPTPTLKTALPVR